MLTGSSPYDKLKSQIKAETKYAWTPERIALLRRMHRDGHSRGQIAKALQTTRNAVSGKIFRLKRKGIGSTRATSEPGSRTL